MDDRLKKHLPIDRGWAWVISLGLLVVTAGAVLFGFQSGNYKSAGIIQVELAEIFPQTSAASLLWLLRLPLIVNKLSGPLNGYLLTKLSHRTLSIIGSLMMALSLAILGYLPSIGYMYPVLGLGFGLGVGAVSLVALTAYTNYFEKKKALALGLTTSGSGLGVFFLPILLRYLFDNWSFSSAMLLYSGMALQMLVLACLLRPISYYEERAKWKLATSVRETIESGNESVLSGESDKLTEGKMCTKDQMMGDGVQRRHSIPASASTLLSPEKPISLIHCAHSLPQNSENTDKHDVESVLFKSTSDIANSGIFYTLENKDADNNDGKTKKKFDCRIAFSPFSLCIGLAIVCYAAGASAVYQCAPPLGQTRETVALALTLAGVMEIPGRIGNGFLADRHVMSAVTQLSLCMSLTGLAALLCALISGLPGIVIMLVVMSSFGTPVYTLMPIVCGELLGQENVTSGMSVNFVYQAVGTIISAFSAGMIYDRTQRWEDVYFYVCGCMLLGGIVSGVVAIDHSIQARRVRVHTNQDPQQ